MGRGRKAIPLKILEMTGSSSLRKARNRGKVELEPPPGRPDAPPLPQYAADVYRSVMTDLEKTPGLLTRIDGPQLERYARYIVRWRLVEAESETVIAGGGGAWKVLGRDELRPVLRSLWAESRKLDQALKEIESNFGMSPSARRSLAVAAKPQFVQKSYKPA
jgi:phage terminase small subunit